ncbi:MAG: hypothetical protein ABL999_00830 [Pyrinomonadaceae bacterium]
MKNLKILLLLLLLAMPAFSADIKSGDDLIAAMYKKYAGKWYKTLTFVQKTITHKADGTSTSETWYEAMTVPGKLRIDFADSKTGDGILFADGKITSFRDGKAGPTRPFVHPLMVLGFDVYGQPVETTVGQVKGLGIDLSVVHVEKWMGKDVYVVGAKLGDVNTPQFWVDKKDLVFVRLIQLGGRDKKLVQETQFNKYVKAKGGWVSAEVKFFTDGKLTTTEEYSDIQAGTALDADLWNPEKWAAVDKTYYKKR